MSQPPTTADIRALITECLDGKSILDFTHKEEFFNWLETATHYDATDAEEHLQNQHEAIDEVYEELFLEEFFDRNKSASEATSEPGDDHYQMVMVLEAASSLRQRLIDLHSNGSPVVSELVHDPMAQVNDLEARLKRWTNVLKPSE